MTERPEPVELHTYAAQVALFTIALLLVGHWKGGMFPRERQELEALLDAIRQKSPMPVVLEAAPGSGFVSEGAVTVTRLEDGSLDLALRVRPDERAQLSVRPNGELAEDGVSTEFEVEVPGGD